MTSEERPLLDAIVKAFTTRLLVLNGLLVISALAWHSHWNNLILERIELSRCHCGVARVGNNESHINLTLPGDTREQTVREVAKELAKQGTK